MTLLLRLLSNRWNSHKIPNNTPSGKFDFIKILIFYNINIIEKLSSIFSAY